MPELTLAYALASFFAGVITFLAPCTLPLVPGYLGFISGVTSDDHDTPEGIRRAEKKIRKNGLLFVAGFSIVFIALGSLAGFAGGFLLHNRILLSRIGGALVIFFGLFMLGLFRLPVLSVEKRLRFPKFLVVGEPFSSLVIGGAFAFGWTPCVGPILASILALASTSGSVLQGTVLLVFFSAGLGLPFICISFAYSNATARIEKFFELLQSRRSLILCIFGLPIGFLINLILLTVAEYGAFGGAVATFGVYMLDTAIFVFPVLGAVVLWLIGKRYRVDVLSFIGGIFLLLLGILLLTDSFGILVQEGFALFRFFNYEELLKNFL